MVELFTLSDVTNKLYLTLANIRPAFPRDPNIVCTWREFCFSMQRYQLHLRKNLRRGQICGEIFHSLFIYLLLLS